MGEPNTDFWIDVYKAQRRTLRVIAGLILLLFLVSVFDGLENYKHLGRQYQIAVDVIIEEQRNEQLKDEISAYVAKPGAISAPPAAGMLPGNDWKVVDLKDVPPLYRKFVRTHDQTVEQEYRIGDQRVAESAYVLALLIGPVLLVAAMAWPLMAIRKLHRRLAPLAEADGPIQQQLNSLFYSRVTSRYRERWKRHVLSFVLGVFLLAATTPFVFLSTRGIVQPNIQLYVNSTGQVFPVDSDPRTSHLVIRSDRTQGGLLATMVGLTMLAAGFVSVLAIRVPQLLDGPSAGRRDSAP